MSIIRYGFTMFHGLCHVRIRYSSSYQGHDLAQGHDPITQTLANAHV